jgi:hypothetical protein
VTLLSQIIAVEKGVRTTAERKLTDAHRTLATTATSGIDRKYQPRDDDGDHFPPESTLVRETVEATLIEVRQAFRRFYDVTATKDWANCVATADIEVGDEVLLAAVPVPFLLFLEKQLINLRTFVASLPVLDPAQKWSRDDITSGVWRAEPTMTVKTKKIPKGQVLYDATDKHPAQVHLYHDDVPIGDWTTVKFSGAIPAGRRDELLDRVDVLARAVKFAREKANATEIERDVEAGQAIVGFLFG